MLKFICYPKCTTCQRAKKWLDDNGIEYDLRDIKLDKPTLDELTEWHGRSGLPLKNFFQTLAEKWHYAACFIGREANERVFFPRPRNRSVFLQSNKFLKNLQKIDTKLRL